MERVNRQPTSPAEEDKRKEKLRDRLFMQLIAARVLVDFHNDLGYADFPEEAFEEFEKEFAELSEADKRAVLAIPAQLREMQFKKYSEKVYAGEMNGADILHDLLTKARANSFGIGFHLSLYDIRPEKDGSWYVRGTEPDHRHDDRPMAYYSTDYSNRYKEKKVNYLYVVRAEMGDRTSHYRDNDGSWGHASSLSIISKIDMAEVEKEFTNRLREMEKTKGESAQDASPLQALAM